MNYFENLNYTLSNEDTRIEHQLLAQGADHVFSISGSGARALPLLAKSPSQLDVVDMSQDQLFLCELRFAAARQLTSEEYLFFLGYRGGLQNGNERGDDRRALFAKLELSAETKQFWSERERLWSPKGFIFLGRWEGHFQKIGRLFRDILRIDTRPIFAAQSLDEQKQLFSEHFKPTVFKLFLRAVANEYVFNRFLYKGHFSGASHHRTETRPPYQFIEEEFTRLFTTGLVRKNYFLQVLFLGSVQFEEGLPLEAHDRILAAARSAKTKVRFVQGNLLDIVTATPYSFISLSDTISYLPQERAAKILTDLHGKTKPGSRVVIRSFLRAPVAMDLTGWKALTQEQSEAEATDGTGVYKFHIFEKV